MQKIKSINITKPCHQSWQEMTTATNGRHCESCCKTVVDFTSMSPGDIVSHLAKGNNTCGRFAFHQLPAVNQILDANQRRTFSWKSLITAASLIFLIPAPTVSAQQTAKTEQGPDLSSKMPFTNAADWADAKKVSGRVIAKSDGLPIPGAMIRVKGKTIGTQTDVQGGFTLAAVQPGDVLIISYLGSMTMEVCARNLNSAVNDIVLIESPFIMGEVSIVRYPFYKRWWRSFKRLF